MSIQPHDDEYQWLNSYGAGRRRRRLNYFLNKRGGIVALWIGIGAGVSLGIMLLPRLMGGG